MARKFQLFLTLSRSGKHNARPPHERQFRPGFQLVFQRDYGRISPYRFWTYEQEESHVQRHGPKGSRADCGGSVRLPQRNERGGGLHRHGGRSSERSFGAAGCRRLRETQECRAAADVHGHQPGTGPLHSRPPSRGPIQRAGSRGRFPERLVRPGGRGRRTHLAARYFADAAAGGAAHAGLAGTASGGRCRQRHLAGRSRQGDRNRPVRYLP